MTSANLAQWDLKTKREEQVETSKGNQINSAGDGSNKAGRELWGETEVALGWGAPGRVVSCKVQQG